MKTTVAILLIFSLVACQKEIELYKDPKTGQTPVELPPIEPQPEPPAEDTIYREEPNQEIDFFQFAKMLKYNRQYSITEYYEKQRNLWSDMPLWMKDDIFTFNESGKAWADLQADQHSQIHSSTLELHWKLYGDDEGIKLDWIDIDYNVKSYLVVAYEIDKYFTIAEKINNQKVFTTYTFLGIRED